MKTIHLAMLLAAASLAACRKPHGPSHPGKCPEPANCQMTIMHTTQGNGPRSEGLPENTAEITRDAHNRPVKYRGYATGWERPFTHNISYPGNRMVLTDSATGRKSMEVWLNACGQPDSLVFYPHGFPEEYPHKAYYEYGPDKKIKRIRSVYSAFTTFPSDHVIEIHRDEHGNVLEMTDGSSFTKWTYDYDQPTEPLQFGYLTAVTPQWAGTITLERFGLIDFRPKHLPKTMQDCMNGYLLSPVRFSDFVISRGKVLSYHLRDAQSDPNSPYFITITHTWSCRNNSGGPKF